MTPTRSFTLIVLPLLFLGANAAPAVAQVRGAGDASSSLLERAMRGTTHYDPGSAVPPPVHALDAVSLFRVPAPEPRQFLKHDLVQIVVRETSTAKSSQELETNKEFDLDGRIDAWPHLSLEDIIDLQVRAGRSDELPAVGLGLSKEFTGDGEYQRKDDLTARLTAEVIEVLPNGNLVLEARTRIATDDETSTMKVTGICRPEDVTTLNTVLSNQVHDLKIEKVHGGELKRSAEKGLVTRVLDALFAW